ncbi:asparagine synthase (glutamine-hydrolyzing) [Phormidium tenue]|uniref:asparagine synthase (glutamine-hydrolyzing) n=1 Tax=Phormidium tenue NIES-30 TaxID=549789 RepID=A0A1U7J8C6_9CYAN|nr:asparagine synthase (glutamine-hydrolyzing) [Phormidium tenue]MBD2231238.1 asparagine synthase (glutamine-hydrolyzing) [Phormidium tenue FACHB-1052]OKH49485.1 asparagine synthase (glutamine-hydrolyzing) [Phormidium tenue NIES-30]
MCGVAGVINLRGEPVPSGLVQAMTDAIAHRGTDGEGQWVEDNVGLGHRRLAIIDLSAAGQQPMISADYRYVLSYNGEVYNFLQLRSELERAGYWFRSKTDTEVVLYALIEWGVKAFDRFNGMFALALWDRKERTLLLGRDRYGIKPIYYATFGSTFLFGSEQKAILAHPDAERQLDKAALLEYFTFQNIFTDSTLLQNVKLLPAGHYGVLNLNAGAAATLDLTRYWDYRFREPEGKVDAQAYREELDRLLQQAVNRQLVADVEMGAYLSGGMDSGTLTALAAREMPYIKTFTCGFDLSSASGIELGFDERIKAEAMSARFKTEHYEMVLKAGDMERCLPKLAWHLEEPRVGQSYPNYYVAQLASKFVKVVLSGSGGDELFGGYPWRYYRAAVNQDFEHYIDQYYLYWQRLVNNSELKRMFAPVWPEVEHVWTRDIFRDVFATHDNALDRPEDYINHSLYLEAKTFLHGLFVVEDKLSMAHGLESRVPFMDNDLVDFAMQCPVGLKLNNLTEAIRINENEPGGKRAKYFQKTNDGKQILRDVMSRYVPKEIIKATKQGFSSPDASWFKGESIEFVKRTLLDNEARIYQIVDRESVTRLIDDHLQGTENRRLLIWSLLNIEQWCESFLLSSNS